MKKNNSSNGLVSLEDSTKTWRTWTLTDRIGGSSTRESERTTELLRSLGTPLLLSWTTIHSQTWVRRSWAGDLVTRLWTMRLTMPVIVTMMMMEETWPCSRTRRSTITSLWWDQSKTRVSVDHVGPSQPPLHWREPWSSDRERLTSKMLRRMELLWSRKLSGGGSQSSTRSTVPTDLLQRRMLTDTTGTHPICRTMDAVEADRTGLGTSWRSMEPCGKMATLVTMSPALPRLRENVSTTSHRELWRSRTGIGLSQMLGRSERSSRRLHWVLPSELETSSMDIPQESFPREMSHGVLSSSIMLWHWWATLQETNPMSKTERFLSVEERPRRMLMGAERLASINGLAGTVARMSWGKWLLQTVPGRSRTLGATGGEIRDMFMQSSMTKAEASVACTKMSTESSQTWKLSDHEHVGPKQSNLPYQCL